MSSSGSFSYQQLPPSMKHSPTRLLFIALFTLLPGLAPAEDEPAEKVVLEFFKEEIPEALVMLKYIQDNEPIDIYQERFGHLSELFIEYHALAEDEGKKHADSFLREIRLDYDIEALTHTWHTLESPCRFSISSR